MAQHRHKRVISPRRLPRACVIGASMALLVTGPVVAIGVMAAGPTGSDVSDVAQAPIARDGLRLSDLQDERADGFVSRAGIRADRAAAEARAAQERKKRQQAIDRRAAAESRQRARATTNRAVAQAETHMWTTAPLNLWSAARADASKVGLLESEAKVLLTGRQQLGRVEVVHHGQSLWVNSGYLSDESPEKLDEVSAAIGGACTNGTSVPAGVSPNVAAVHGAVCAAFPSISTYGTLRGGGGDHPLGRAVDIMVSGAPGWEVAEYVRANYARLGVSYVIYAQKIWSVQRGGRASAGCRTVVRSRRTTTTTSTSRRTRKPSSRWCDRTAVVQQPFTGTPSARLRLDENAPPLSSLPR